MSMRAILTALILGAGVVNLLPAIGVLSAGRLQSLYGVVIEDPNLAILMRHRAVLFAIVGALLVASAFHPALRPVAFAAGFVSMGSFVALALLVGDYNPALRRIVLIDVVASLGLLIAAILDRRDASPGF
jgi:hypothetical protein